MPRSKFGRKLRSLREASGWGLRGLAEQAGISPTYLSVLERDDTKTPPSEKVVFQLAELLGYDKQELLAFSGRVPAKVEKIILKHPREVIRLILAVKNMSPQDITKETNRIEKARSRKQDLVERTK